MSEVSGNLMDKNNMFSGIPGKIREEIFETLVNKEHIKIERIISSGQSSPENFWYDQDKNEWIILLKGSAGIQYEDGSLLELITGDYVNIPAHIKHRVAYTDKQTETIWLAVFY